MQDPEKTEVLCEAPSKLKMEDLFPGVENFNKWEEIVGNLTPLDLEHEERLESQILLNFINDEKTLILTEKQGVIATDLVGVNWRSFTGVSTELITQIEERVKGFGAVSTIEDRFELCKSVKSLIRSFFKARRSSRASRRSQSVRHRNLRIQAFFQSAQARIGGKIDESYIFAPKVIHHLYPYEAKVIDWSRLGATSLNEAFDLVSQYAGLDHMILTIEDVFENPRVYPDFYLFLGENGNLRELKEFYAYLNALVDFRDQGGMQPHEENVEAVLCSTNVAVRVEDVMQDNMEPPETHEDLGMELPWSEPDPVIEEVSAAVEEVLDEIPSTSITMRDMARLLRMMVWERDTLTNRMVTNMNHSRTREGSFRWKECHFKVPEELRTFMKAVYEHPRTKGGLRHLQFYMALWLENYMHWFKDEFHPEVFTVLNLGAIDSGLELNDLWVDPEKPKSGFDDSNLMAIESDLPWPK